MTTGSSEHLAKTVTLLLGPALEHIGRGGAPSVVSDSVGFMAHSRASTLPHCSVELEVFARSRRSTSLESVGMTGMEGFHHPFA